MFAREGYPFILGAAAFAAITFAMALRLRSWPLWLVAIALTVVALCVAWFFRNPTRVSERGANVAVAPVDARIVGNVSPTAMLRFALRQRTSAGKTVFADLTVT